MNADLLELLISGGPEPGLELERDQVEIIQRMRPGMSFGDAACIWIRLMDLIWRYGDTPVLETEE